MSISVSIMQGGVNNHPTTSEEANGLATDFVSEGIVGAYTNTSGVAPATGAFAVNAQGTPDMTVAVSAGVAYVTGTPSSQNSQTFRVKSGASENVTIAANSSGSTKYDWVYIKLDATLLNAPTLAGTTTATLVTSRSTSSSSDDGTPPTYGYPIAVVTVANGASSIANSVIRDIRTNAGVDTAAGANTGWISGALPQVSSVTENGNRSASITFASTVASILTPGMKLRTSRTVAAPTQCTSLNGSTQYYSKTTPNKLTFTDDYTTMAWVYLTSYGAESGILGRRNADVEGFSLGVNSSGQLFSTSLRIAANNSQTVSYQSIPLNKWVHVAATTDLSGTSVLLYIDGVLVPSATTITGTITALVQGTTALVIGALKSAGTSVWPGKIAQVAIFNSVLSASTIRSYKNQGLSGSESGLQSAYSFNNSIADLNTTTPNDLTAQGSAVATNADSPFTKDANGTPGGTYDWGIVTAVSTTVATVSYPEACAIPTSGGISTVDYSGVAKPFGFPKDNRFPISAMDASGTTALALANTLVSVGILQPIDNMKFAAHTGNAGGTFYLSQVGAEKTIHGVTANCGALATNGTASLTVNYPFTFTSVYSYTVGGYNPTIDNRVHAYANPVTTSVLTVVCQSYAATANSTIAGSYIVRGV